MNWNPMAQSFDAKPLSLADFLFDRFRETEEVARYALVSVGPSEGRVTASWRLEAPGTVMNAPAPVPSTIIADSRAKRWIVVAYLNGDINAHDFETVIGPALALPYADHPDYRADEWRP